MIKARATSADGTPIFIVGLSDGNLGRLREGKPILFEMSQIGGGPGRMLIYWGATEEAMKADLEKYLTIDPERRE
jgi:hypothetical protein